VEPIVKCGTKDVSVTSERIELREKTKSPPVATEAGISTAPPSRKLIEPEIVAPFSIRTVPPFSATTGTVTAVPLKTSVPSLAM
jgi:hypothetical protein